MLVAASSSAEWLKVPLMCILAWGEPWSGTRRQDMPYCRVPAAALANWTARPYSTARTPSLTHTSLPED